MLPRGATMLNDFSGRSAPELPFPERLTTIIHIGVHVAHSIGHFENLGSRNSYVARLDEFYISYDCPFNLFKKGGWNNQTDTKAQLYRHVLWIEDGYSAISCLNVIWDKQGEAKVAYFRDFRDPVARGWDRRLQRRAEREFRSPTATFLSNSSFRYPPNICG
jgi:hypothetical protein